MSGGMAKGWVVCPCMMKMKDSWSSGVTPLEVLVCGDVNMADVDCVKEATGKAVVLPPYFQGIPV